MDPSDTERFTPGCAAIGGEVILVIVGWSSVRIG